MRAPLLRLALLLAAAQYAEASACTGVAPKVACQHNPDPEIKTSVDCKDYVLGTACAALTFMEKAGVWTTVTEVTCDDANNVWTVPGATSGVTVPLTGAETIVCAKRAPDTKKCGLCDEVGKGACAADVCEAGAAITPSISSAGCPEMTCASDEILSLNAHSTLLDKTIHKITCNEQKKWTDGGSLEVAVTDALCVKSFECPEPAGLGPNCADTALIKDAADCEAPGKDNGALKCATGKEIFVPSGLATWIKGTVKCDTAKGKWMLDGTATEITKAVCAILDPTPGSSTAVQCPLAATLAPCADATVVDPASDCKAPTSPSDVLTCADPPSTKLFVDTGAGWELGAGKCESAKWILIGATPTEIKKAVCAKQSPSISGSSGTACTQVVDSCAESGIKTTAPFVCKQPDLDNAVLKCATAALDLYAFIDTKWEKGTSTCGAAGKWEMTVNGAAKPFTKAVCASEHPVDAPAPGPSGVPCKQCADPPSNAACTVTGGCTPGDAPNVDTAQACKELTCKAGQFFGINNEDVDAQTAKITCNAQKQWETTGSTVTTVTDAICITKLSCTTKNPLNLDCSPFANQLVVGCAEAAPTDDAEYGCTDAAKSLFYKLTAADKWANSASKIKCDTKTGLWSIDDKTMKAGGKLICAAKNPDEAFGTGCPAAFADADYGCKPEEGCEAGAMVDSQPDEITAKLCGDGEFFVDKTGQWIDTDKIVCNHEDKWETNKATPVEVTGASCVKPFKCQERTKLLSSPDADGKDVCVGCTQPIDFAASELGCHSSLQFYHKKTTGGLWTLATKIECDVHNGKWMQTPAPTAADPTPAAVAMTAGDILVCIDDSPPNECAAPLTECPQAPEPADPDCEVVTAFPSDAPLTCPAGKNIHIGDAPETVVQCNTKTGKWQKKYGSPQAVDLDETEKVKCTTPKTCFDVKALLGNSCQTPLPSGKLIPECEEMPIDTDTPVCAPIVAPDGTTTTTKKPYFKKSGSEFWMEATAAKCHRGKWKIEFMLGTTATIEDFDVNTDKVICVAANPTKEACKYLGRGSDTDQNYEYIQSRREESGKWATCEKDNFEFDAVCKIKGTSTIKTFTKPLMTAGNSPICYPNGTWIWKDPDTSKIHIMDDPTCKIQKCKMCGDLPAFTLPSSHLLHPQSALKTNAAVGACKDRTCGGDKRLVLTLSEDTTKYKYYAGDIVCNALGTNYVEAESKKDITAASCIQHTYCHNPDSMMIDYTCPAGMADCEQIKMPPATERDNAYLPLACPSPDSKILIQRKNVANDQYWDELTSINCDDRTAQWNITYELGGKEYQQFRDYENTLVCAKTNPNPRPAPTTTTAATTTLAPICALCESHLPPKDCGSEKDCDFSTMADFIPSSDGHECVMKRKEGFQIQIATGNGSTTQVYDELICPRAEDIVWYAKVDGNATGPIVSKFLAKKTEKNKDWKPMVYVVIAVTLTAIGGMGIGCVMIFLRMRKNLSEKEKKKERGVTKKYTTANVMKTSGKSSGGRSELGKSKEPTKSKMEENEDAPTLKL